MSRFLERLRSGPPIVADGGMGALVASAVPGLRCPEEANLRAPESVLEVHLGYIRAGAELIETNTFGANRAKLGRQFIAEEFEAINAAAARIAREAREVAGRDVFIGGSIGPLGDVELRGHDTAELFAEQAHVLEGRGVDLFMVETFFDLDELETALTAIRSVSALPLVALLTFDADGETLAGVTAEDAAARLRTLEARRLRREPRRRPGGRTRGARADAGTGRRRARGSPERRPREHVGRADRLPPRDARILRGVRGAGARARRPRDRRLLRDDAGPDRRDSGRGRRGAAAERRLLSRPPTERSDPRGGGGGRDTARADAARGRVRRLGPARPAARRKPRGADRDGPRASATRAARSSWTSTTTRGRGRG